MLQGQQIDVRRFDEGIRDRRNRWQTQQRMLPVL